MSDITFHEMHSMQRELQEKYKDQWGALSPAVARQQLLWLFTEVAEVTDIVKKDGEDAIMNNPEVRRHFTEEMCDVLMYFNDIMLCYSMTPEELSQAYVEKHHKNMKRW